MENTILLLAASIIIGKFLAEIFKSLSPNGQKVMVKVVNGIAILSVIAIAYILRPMLPHDGAWSIFHSKKELELYTEAKALGEELSKLVSSFEEYSYSTANPIIKPLDNVRPITPISISTNMEMTFPFPKEMKEELVRKFEALGYQVKVPSEGVMTVTYLKKS